MSMFKHVYRSQEAVELAEELLFNIPQDYFAFIRLWQNNILKDLEDLVQ